MTSEHRAAVPPFRNRTDHNLVAKDPYDAAAQKSAAWAPLLRELRELGFDVDHPQSLHLFAPYVPAIPVLIDYLRRDEADQVRVDVAGALDVKEASPWWDEIKALYLGPNGPLTKSALAFVLSTLVTNERLDGYLELVMDPGNGSSRGGMLRKLKRIKDPRGCAALEALRDDPTVSAGVDAIFRGRGPRA